jgi:hypothetical protein
MNYNQHGPHVSISEDIKKEMRILKARMTARAVCDEIERRHGFRPGRANTNRICRGIAPQKSGPRRKVVRMNAANLKRAGFHRIAMLIAQPNDELFEEIANLVTYLHGAYNKKLLKVRVDLIKARASMVDKAFFADLKDEMKRFVGRRIERGIQQTTMRGSHGGGHDKAEGE